MDVLIQRTISILINEKHLKTILPNNTQTLMKNFLLTYDNAALKYLWFQKKREANNFAKENQGSINKIVTKKFCVIFSLQI